MKLSKRQIFSLVLTALFTILMLYANFYIVKLMEHRGVKLYFYGRLLVAYQSASTKGVNNELDRILAQDKTRPQFALAMQFKDELRSIKDPGGFLEDTVEKETSGINFLKNLRAGSIALITLLILLRIFLTLSARRR